MQLLHEAIIIYKKKMTIMKKLIEITFPIVLLCFILHASLNAKSLSNTRYTDSLDESLFLDDDITLDFLDIEGSPGFSMTRATNPTVILNALLSVNAISLLEQNLYLRSNPLHSRTILDSPLFEPHPSFYEDDSVLGMHIFYTQMVDCDFVKNKHLLKYYIALSEPTLIDALENSVSQIKDLFATDAFNFNIKEIFDLFKHGTIEERRLGAMFHVQRHWKNLHFFALLPIYYKQRNFQYTTREKKLIEKEFGDSDPKFIKDHLVSDALGMGDTRIEFDGSIYKSKKAELRIGLISTIPTAWTFKKGIYGSYFPKKCSQPSFDLNALFDLVEDGIQTGESEKAFNMITTFVLGALDRLSANVLDPALGNNGHLGLGFFVRSKTTLSSFFKGIWAKNITWNWRGSVEYLSGKELKRMFIKFPNPAEFNKRDFETTDEILAQEYVDFLEKQLVDQFYPPFLETVVHPGFIFRSTNSFTYFPKHFGITIGSDFWYQTKETFEINNIDASSSIINSLKIDTAKLRRAYQAKIIVNGMWKIERPKRDWILSLNGDYTWMNYGIGNDWSIGFNFEAHF